MDTKNIILQVTVSVYIVIFVYSADLLEPDTLELWVGTTATLKCRQRGPSVSAIVDDPVFVVRTPDGQTTRITEDDTQYFLASGKIDLSKSLPERRYYLGILEVSDADNGMMVICISKVDSMYSESLDDHFQDWSTTLKVKAYEGCQTSSSEPNFLMSTDKTTIMEETTRMTSGSSDATTSRSDSLTAAFPKSEESDSDQGAQKQIEDQGKANSTNNRLDTMTSVVIVLAACLILALAACTVMYSKYRTKCWSCGSPTNTAVKKDNADFEMENEDASIENLPDRGPV